MVSLSNALGFATGGLGLAATKKGRGKLSSFFLGSPEEHERVSTLRPEQEALYRQAVQAGMQPGAGGAFGTAADYYRGLFDENNPTYSALAAPEMRQFREDIIPGLSEQFAGMGAGGLSSSGFRNAAVGAGTDLAERLGAIRAQLRQQGAAGLQNIGQFGLGNFSQDVMTRPGSEGFLGQIAPAVGTIAGSFLGGPAGGAAGGGIGSGISNFFKGGGSKPVTGQLPIKGSTSPYGAGQSMMWA